MSAADTGTRPAKRKLTMAELELLAEKFDSYARNISGAPSDRQAADLMRRLIEALRSPGYETRRARAEGCVNGIEPHLESRMEIRHESAEHENAAGELLRVLDAALAAKFSRRMGVGLFIFDFGGEKDGGGFLGWAANAPREDTSAMLIEWLGTNTPEILQQAVERWRLLGLLGPGAEREQ